MIFESSSLTSMTEFCLIGKCEMSFHTGVNVHQNQRPQDPRMAPQDPRLNNPPPQDPRLMNPHHSRGGGHQQRPMNGMAGRGMPRR